MSRGQSGTRARVPEAPPSGRTSGAEDSPGFSYDAVTGAVTRDPLESNADAVPRQQKALFYTAPHPIVRGRGVPALDSALISDGARTCGQPAHPAGFATLFGKCDAWVGLTERGVVLRGGSSSITAPPAITMNAPVGEVRALEVAGDRIYVGGTEALAVWDGASWDRIPAPGGVEALSVWRGNGKETIWWAGTELCRLDRAQDAAARCQNLASARSSVGKPSASS